MLSRSGVGTKPTVDQKSPAATPQPRYFTTAHHQHAHLRNSTNDVTDQYAEINRDTIGKSHFTQNPPFQLNRDTIETSYFTQIPQNPPLQRRPTTAEILQEQFIKEEAAKPPTADQQQPKKWIDHPIAPYVIKQDPWTEEDYARLIINPEFDQLREITWADEERWESCLQLYRRKTLAKDIPLATRITNCRQMHGVIAHDNNQETSFPITGITRLPDIVKFRQEATDVIRYHTENPTAAPEIIQGNLITSHSPTILKPPFSANMPMLYRVINTKGPGSMTIEAMHFELFWQRPELRYLALDAQTSWNRSSQTRGTMPTQTSIGDLVWVYNITLPWELVMKRHIQNAIESTRYDYWTTTQDVIPILQVKEFDLVTPSTRAPTTCIIQHIDPDYNNPYIKSTTIRIPGEYRPCLVGRDINRNQDQYQLGAVMACTPRNEAPASIYLVSIPRTSEEDD
ncbi:unnamed protein product, partial [Mesorhabditis spiculigera]